jgi:RNA polymerase-binding transcription factor DksA
MIYPTIKELTGDKFNRYQLAIATAKCARIITDEYSTQRKNAEKLLTGNKDVDRPMMEHAVNADYRDRKAVKIAIDKLDDGEFVICEKTEDGMSFEGNPNNS